MENMRIDVRVKVVAAHVQCLTPAGRRMLYKLVKAFHAGNKALTRRDIAQLLHRTNITPHDCTLLNSLVEHGLLKCERVALYTHDERPAGSRFLYRMSPDIKNAIIRLIQASRTKS